jgi:hypothetical protein
MDWSKQATGEAALAVVLSSTLTRATAGKWKAGLGILRRISKKATAGQQGQQFQIGMNERQMKKTHWNGKTEFKQKSWENPAGSWDDQKEKEKSRFTGKLNLRSCGIMR